MSKKIHTLIIDAGPLIKNDPSVDSLLAQSTELVSTESLKTEVRDSATRARLALVEPFLTYRAPKPSSVEFVVKFAKKTGDLEVLSKPDIHLLALTYEIAVERGQGQWKPRDLNPGTDKPEQSQNQDPNQNQDQELETTTKPISTLETETSEPEGTETKEEETPNDVSGVTESMEQVRVSEESSDVEEAPEDDDSDGEWITPSNLKQQMSKDAGAAAVVDEPTHFEVALLTSDYAMQNVALRIGLDIMSPSLYRITELRHHVLRCHGCFQITRQMSRQFCPRCGQATLTRVSCSTDRNGRFQIHLKRNFQYNTRGNRFSIPNPTHGTASGKLRKDMQKQHAGGTNGWGRDLILAEDQKEYQRAVQEKQRQRQRDLMDDDYLPGLMGGQNGKSSANGKVRVGAGRNVNSRKRH